MTQARPNILLAVFDSLSGQDLNTYLNYLPVLRGFAAQSHVFTRAYTCCPESSPARASLFTGLDIAAHGLWTDGVALPRREVPVPEVFAAQGYQSWLVGRRQLAGVANWTTEHPRPREYHHFDWAHGPLHRSRQNAYLEWLHQVAPEIHAEIFPRQADPDNTKIPPEKRDLMARLPRDLSFNTWVGQQVCARIGKVPFFGIAGFVVGQTMGAAEARSESLDPGALRAADAALGRVLECLPADTVVVVTAGRGSVADTATTHPLQEAAINVPLLIRLPGGTAQSTTQPVSTLDIVPTLFECAGLVPPQRMQGQSLIAAIPRGWTLTRMRHPEGPDQTALVAQGRKLVVTHDGAGEVQLFDLRDDPSEIRNLAETPDHNAAVEEMLDLMIDARVALEDRTEPRIAKF